MPLENARVYRPTRCVLTSMTFKMRHHSMHLGAENPSYPQKTCFTTAVAISLGRGINILASLERTRAKQAQACNTAPCLRISDIFT